MPVDDIIEEVRASQEGRATDIHTRQRRPGDAVAGSTASSSSPRQDENLVPTTRSRVHNPRAHYEALKVRTEIDRDALSYFSTWFSLVTGVIRLL